MSVSETLLSGSGQPIWAYFAGQMLGSLRKEAFKKVKGCDIGYALAANSCEGASGMDACTVTAFDVITAFAISNPGLLLAGLAGFFGLEWPANRFV